MNDNLSYMGREAEMLRKRKVFSFFLKVVDVVLLVERMSIGDCSMLVELIH